MKSKLTDSQILDFANKEWEKDYIYLQNLCLQLGYSQKEIHGDSYYVPGIKCLADMIFAKVDKKHIIEKKVDDPKQTSFNF